MYEETPKQKVNHHWFGKGSLLFINDFFGWGMGRENKEKFLFPSDHYGLMAKMVFDQEWWNINLIYRIQKNMSTLHYHKLYFLMITSDYYNCWQSPISYWIAWFCVSTQPSKFVTLIWSWALFYFYSDNFYCSIFIDFFNYSFSSVSFWNSSLVIVALCNSYLSASISDKASNNSD